MTDYPSKKIKIWFTILPLIIELIFPGISLILFMVSGVGGMVHWILFGYVVIAGYLFIPLLVINFLVGNYFAEKEFYITHLSDYLHVGKIGFISVFIVALISIKVLTEQPTENTIQYLLVCSILAILISLVHSVLIMLIGLFALPKQ